MAVPRSDGVVRRPAPSPKPKKKPAPAPAREPTLEELTARVRETLATWHRSDARSRVEIGQALRLIKAKLDHGAFLPWVKNNLPFTARSAQQYIEVYEWSVANPPLFEKIARYGPAKLYVLIRLDATTLTTLLSRKLFVVPSTGAAKTLADLNPSEFMECVAELTDKPATDEPPWLAPARARARAMLLAVDALIEHADEVPDDLAEDIHDALLAGAARLAKTFDLGD